MAVSAHTSLAGTTGQDMAVTALVRADAATALVGTFDDALTAADGKAVAAQDAADRATVASVPHMLSLTVANETTVNVYSYLVGAGFVDSTPNGGGKFQYNATLNANNHNGITVISSHATWPADWTNETQVATWFDYGGAALGAWVRQEDGVVSSHCAGLTSTQTVIDSVISQRLVLLENSIYFENGLYFGQGITLPDSGSYYRADTHARIEFGPDCWFTQNANTIELRSTIDYSDMEEWDKFILIVPGSHMDFIHFKFIDAVGGIYIGDTGPRDAPNDDEENSATELLFDRITGKNYGCGLMIRGGERGSYYTSYNQVNLMQGQVGVYLGKGITQTFPGGNVNRNTFTDLHVSRNWVGMWVANGTTNKGKSLAFEECETDKAVSYTTQPVGVPAAVGLNAIAMIVNELSNYNNFHGVDNEQCDLYLYDAGLSNSYEGTLRINEQPQDTGLIQGKPRSIADRGLFYTSDNNGDPLTLYSDNATSIGGFTHKPGRHHCAKPAIFREGSAISSTDGTIRASKIILDGGDIVDTASFDFTLDADVAGKLSCSTTHLLTITAHRDSPAIASFCSRYIVSLKRSATRTLTRYAVSLDNAIMSNGAGASNTTAITCTLSVSDKDLIASVALAGSDLIDVSIVIESISNNTTNTFT